MSIIDKKDPLDFDLYVPIRTSFIEVFSLLTVPRGCECELPYRPHLEIQALSLIGVEAARCHENRNLEELGNGLKANQNIFF
jgi:hypothetical protein